MDKKVLDNGLTILVDTLELAKSVSVSYFVNVGSYDEHNYPTGIAHFIEHMLFKGTKNRDHYRINEEIDEIGGVMNAYTDYEKTKYYCVVPYDKWEIGLDVFSDLIWNHIIPEEELEKERTVIFEEIKMYNDDPVSVAYDTIHKEMHSKYKVRQSIIGTRETVGSITRDDILKFIDEFYQPNNITLVVTGNVDIDEIEKYFNNYSFSRNGKTNKVESDFEKESMNFNTIEIKRDIEQSHLTWGLFSPSAKDEDSYVMDVISNILGGGMSSRLYRIIREERGLAYSVSVDSFTLSDSGFIIGHTGLEKEKINEVKDIIVEEFERLSEEEISDSELNKAINNTTGTFMLMLEKPSSLNDYQGISHLMGNSTDPDEYINKIKGVTKDDIMRVASKYFVPDNWQFVQVVPK